jgi:hypothetical protein
MKNDGVVFEGEFWECWFDGELICVININN